MKRPRGKTQTGQDKSTRIAAAHLSSEEHALWTYVAESIEPLRSKQRVASHADDDVAAERPPRPRRSAGAEFDHHRPVSGAKKHAEDSAEHKRSAGLAAFDARKVKKIARGRTDIDARLDLHFLRQDEAHLRLRRFLLDCHHRGLKHVLVITGKGRSDDDATVSFADRLDKPVRGVLRRMVPRWLAEPDLRPVVVGFTTASARHGGDGAYYIELRRRR